MRWRASSNAHVWPEWSFALIAPIGIVGAFAFVACGRSESSTSASFSVDTLPSGGLEIVNVRPSRWSGTDGWQLVEDLRISGESNGLVSPESITEDADGRIYVADISPALIKSWNGRGTFLGTIGREGAGPGEYRQPMLGMLDSALVVQDPQLSRLTLFDQKGGVIRTFLSTCCAFGDIGVDRAGRITVPGFGGAPPAGGRFYVRFTREGAALDTLRMPQRETRQLWTLKLPTATMSRAIPFSPTQVSALDPAGNLVTGWSGDYRIAVVDWKGDTIQVFGRQWSASTIPSAVRELAVERAVKSATKSWGEAPAREAFRLEDVPRTAPAFSTIAVDANENRWILVDNMEDSSGSHYDVFDSLGVLLGEVKAPAPLMRVVAADWMQDHVVAISSDSSGYPMMIRFHVVR